MKKILIGLLSVLILAGTVGCKDDYLNTSPTTSLSDEMLKQTPAGVSGVLEGIHGMMYTYTFAQVFGYGAPSLNTQLDFLGNSVVNSVAAYHMGVYRWTDHRDPQGAINFYAWDFYYTLIQHCNTLLKMVDESEDLKKEDPKIVNGMIGEAKVLRAYCYANLTQLFGKRYVKGGDNSTLGVILRLEPSIDQMPRSTVEECYTQINLDIKEGLSALEKGVQQTRKNRISMATAYGIAARVALAQQEYNQAEQYAAKAIQSFDGELQDGEKLVDGFNNFEADEWMWGYRQAPDQNLYFAGYGAQYSYNFAGHNQGLKFAINRSYYDKMGENDARRKWFVALDQGDKIPEDADASYFEGGTSKPGWETTGQLIKFRTKNPEASSMDNVMMRLGEMYYIQAESQARQGKVAEAAATLNKVMVTRDPDYVADATLSADELAKEILRNKKIDLFYEGQDFFDMKRLGEIPNRLASGNDAYMDDTQKASFNKRNTGVNVKGLPADANDKVWEFVIPYDEIKGNQLCEQNPM